MRILKSAVVAIGFSFLVPIAAHAQCNVFFPSGTICGNSTGSQTTPRAGLPGAFGIPTLSANDTWTGFNTFAPTAATSPAVTINPLAATLGQGLVVNQSIAGTSSAAQSYNLIQINPDAAVITGANFGVGFNVAHTINGTLVQGGRVALNGYLELAAPTSASNNNRNYSAILGTGTATAGDGGTNTGAGAKGAIFAVSAHGDLQSGATNILNVTGGEYNCSIRTGASARYKSCMQLIEHALDAVSAADLDALLAISGQGGAIGVNTGISFSDFAGQHAVKSTGTLIATTGGTFAAGIDFSASTLTNLLKGPSSFGISGIGNITAPSATEWLLGTASSASLSNIMMMRLNASTGSIIDLLGNGNIFGRLQGDNVNGLTINASFTPSKILLQAAGTTSLTITTTSVTSSVALGYTTGVGTGGTVTQATSKTTGVTLNKVVGEVVLNNSNLADSTNAAFTLTNSAIAANDGLAVWVKSGGTANVYAIWTGTVSAGSASIVVRNVSGGALAEAITIGFGVIKGSIN